MTSLLSQARVCILIKWKKFTELGDSLASQLKPIIWGIWDWTIEDPVQIMVTPEGNGTPFTAANFFGGSTVDATIRMQLWGQGDSMDDPPYIQVIVAGDPLEVRDEVIIPQIFANSPDINSDLSVNLIDLGLFTADFFGDYNFRSDFFWDGVLKLSDVGRFSAALGGECD